MSQIVAYNMAAFRRAADLTQEELGRLIGGWSAASVSAAERSWDGKRVKKFDADELVAIAFALGVPLIALFLPPPDDGADVDYWLELNDDKRFCPAGMGLFVGAVVMYDSDEETPQAQEYRDRLNAAAQRYLDPEWAASVARWLGKLEAPGVLALRVGQFRDRQHAALDDARAWGELADALEVGDEQ